MALGMIWSKDTDELDEESTIKKIYLFLEILADLVIQLEFVLNVLELFLIVFTAL